MTRKERHKKPRFSFNGGIMFCDRTFDEPIEGATGARIWFGPLEVRRLLDAYHWWRRRRPEEAHITDMMLMRWCSAFQVIRASGSKSEYVMRSGNVFHSHPDSAHSAEWRKHKVRKAKPGSRFTLKDVERLIASGYARVSNSSMTITRLDDPEWEWRLADAHTDPSLPPRAGREEADHYRRCYSKDKVRLDDRALYQMFPGSYDAPVIYLPMCED